MDDGPGCEYKSRRVASHLSTSISIANLLKPQAYFDKLSII